MIITLLVVIVLIIFAIKFFVANVWEVDMVLIIMWIFMILAVGFLSVIAFSGKTVTIPVEEKDIKSVETINILKYEVSDVDSLSCYYMDGQELKIASISRRNSKIICDPSLSYAYLEIYKITGFNHWWTYIYAFPWINYYVIHTPLLGSD